MIKPTSYNTVQELIDGGFTITVYCHNPRCHRRAELDLKAVRAKLGPDHSMLFDAIKDKLHCSKCGGRQVGMVKNPPSVRKGRGWTYREPDEG
jgi:hypothetical protein